MKVFRPWLRQIGLPFWSLAIAIILWLQVHGQGLGSLSMDVPLQVHGLSQNMMIVNDLPDHIRVTINGLQARLTALKPQDIHISLNASEITDPGVVERALKVSDIRLPVGLSIEKLQPDRIELQVDRVETRTVPVRVRLELPEGWQVKGVAVEPAEVSLSGPEIWLDALKEVETTPVRPELKIGLFEVKVGVESPTGKAIRLVNPKEEFTVRGMLASDQGKQGGSTPEGGV
ncbi:MAG: YbbR-like domain-containing protein [Mariprofundaceae bacterium]